VETYEQDPTEYLDGAHYCLERGDHRHLAYAALELRRFVEARQYEYLVAQEIYRISLPKTHEISKQYRELRRIYGDEKTQMLNFIFEDGSEFTFRFVPISQSLKQRAEAMSQWLHAPRRQPSEDMFRSFRELAEQTYVDARAVNAGNLLCPSLLIGRHTVGKLMAKLSTANSELIARQFLPGVPVTVNVNYE
jgi:hypothetical protein